MLFDALQPRATTTKITNSERAACSQQHAHSSSGLKDAMARKAYLDLGAAAYLTKCYNNIMKEECYRVRLVILRVRRGDVDPVDEAKFALAGGAGGVAVGLAALGWFERSEM